MARFKPVGSRKPKAAPAKSGLIPCMVLLIAGFGLIFLLLYAVLRSGT
ncbi:MAG TPA: hypothetical protein VFW83_07340 [Bryobacteraceae bacterium]|nr:hypothetical protein [Bryobacteraceae bacterium]